MRKSRAVSEAAGDAPKPWMSATRRFNSLQILAHCVLRGKATNSGLALTGTILSNVGVAMTDFARSRSNLCLRPSGVRTASRWPWSSKRSPRRSAPRCESLDGFVTSSTRSPPM
jgi:hypothetical protein